MSWTAAAVAATAAYLAVAPSGELRVPSAARDDPSRTGVPRAGPYRAGAGGAGAGRARAGNRGPRSPAWVTAPWFPGLLAAFAVWQVVGGLLGLVVGAAGGGVVAWWISRLEPAAQQRRREAEAASMPLALDLVVAAVGAGRPTSQVIEVVGEAVGGALGDRFAEVLVRLELGSDPVRVWRDLSDDETLGPLARAFARASRSGTAVGRTLQRSADDLRDVHRADALERARSVGVRTAAPLGACFLPAFLLLGVVPTVAATFASLHLGP